MFLPRITRNTLTLVFLLFTSTIANAQETSLESQDEQFSYSLGVQLARQIMDQVQTIQLPVVVEALSLGITDALKDDLKLSNEEMEAVLTAVQQEALERGNQLMEQIIMQGQQYREDFANQDGVKSTESGLLYRVVEVGEGASPTLEDSVTVHYRGTLVDGTEFDSSYSRNEPTTFPLQGIIPGWQEALQLMKVGSKWDVVIPPELGYGETGSPPEILPHTTLIFEIELLEIN